MDRKKNCQLLVEALRSGEYVQGIKKLRRGVGGNVEYCPLGVGCELFRQNYHGTYHYEWKVLPKVLTTENIYFFCVVERGTNRVLQDDPNFMFEVVRNYYGFSMNDMHKIANMNDDDEYTFDQIADYIEQMEILV